MAGAAQTFVHTALNRGGESIRTPAGLADHAHGALDDFRGILRVLLMTPFSQTMEPLQNRPVQSSLSCNPRRRSYPAASRSTAEQPRPRDPPRLPIRQQHRQLRGTYRDTRAVGGHTCVPGGIGYTWMMTPDAQMDDLRSRDCNMRAVRPIAGVCVKASQR
jgi:hypothetical protein